MVGIDDNFYCTLQEVVNMSSFKERMKILPKEYQVPQLTHLDFDTRLALWNYTLTCTRKYGDFEEIGDLLRKLNNLVIRKPNDEIADWLEILRSYRGLREEEIIKEINDTFIKPRFFLNKAQREESWECWDILQICEILVKNPSFATYSKLFHEIAENSSFDSQNQLVELADKASMLQNARGYNQILETYWVGYSFSVQGDLLPANNQREKEILQEAWELAEKENWVRFLAHYPEAIKHAVGPNHDAKASIRASISALEGLFIQHFDPNGTRATLGGVLREVYTAPVSQEQVSRITLETYNRAKELWDQSNRNNTRHSNGDIIPELEEARKFLLDTAALAVHAMKSIADSSEIW